MMSYNENEDVAVIMLVYNHEKWIEKAITSVLKQNTSVNYKIFIHDDASTDGSSEIIRRFASKYPEKIVPIIETENQYSKGNNVTEITLRKVKSARYVCYCEGDDFWVDTNRLQKEYMYMESHPDCHYCFGNAYCTNFQGDTEYLFYDRYDWNDKKIIKKLNQPESDFSFDEMVLIDFTPTASIMIRMKDVIESNTFHDSFDLTKRLVCCKNGYAHYYNSIFSAYRMGNPSSASGSASQSFEKFYNNFFARHKNVYHEFVEKYGNQYDAIFEHELNRKMVIVYWRFSKWNELRSCACYSELRPRIKLLLWMKMNASPVVTIGKNIYFSLSRFHNKM